MNENQNPPEMKTKRTTIKELAEVLGQDYLTVSSVIKFLVNLGAVKDVGAAPQPTGQRGKPSRVYELPQVVELQFFTDETEVEEKVASLPEKTIDNGENKEQDKVVEDAVEKVN